MSTSVNDECSGLTDCREEYQTESRVHERTEQEDEPNSRPPLKKFRSTDEDLSTIKSVRFSQKEVEIITAPYCSDMPDAETLRLCQDKIWYEVR